jgi:hypothetical protein
MEPRFLWHPAGSLCGIVANAVCKLLSSLISVCVLSRFWRWHVTVNMTIVLDLGWIHVRGMYYHGYFLWVAVHTYQNNCVKLYLAYGFFASKTFSVSLRLWFWTTVCNILYNSPPPPPVTEIKEVAIVKNHDRTDTQDGWQAETRKLIKVVIITNLTEQQFRLAPSNGPNWIKFASIWWRPYIQCPKRSVWKGKLETMDNIGSTRHVNDTVNSFKIDWTIAACFNTCYWIIAPSSNIDLCIYLFSGRKFSTCCDSVVKHYLWGSELFGIWTLSIVRYSKNYRAQSFGNWIYFRPQVKGETPSLLGPLERANCQWFRLAFSKGPNRERVSLLTRGRKQIQFPKRCVL